MDVMKAWFAWVNHLLDQATGIHGQAAHLTTLL